MQERYLMFKGLMQLNFNVLVFTHLGAMSVCIMTRTYPLITGRNEVVAKVMFLQVCVCPQGGRVSASVHAGMPYPPPMENPPRWRTPQMENPSWMENPPGWRTPPDGEPPPGKQTPAYGLRAAGTHPTGMHSCLVMYGIACKERQWRFIRQP